MAEALARVHDDGPHPGGDADSEFARLVPAGPVGESTVLDVRPPGYAPPKPGST